MAIVQHMPQVIWTTSVTDTWQTGERAGNATIDWVGSTKQNSVSSREQKAEQQFWQGKEIGVAFGEDVGLTLWHTCGKGWSPLVMGVLILS